MLTTKYAAPASRPEAGGARARCAVPSGKKAAILNTLAAASDASVSAPTLKRTLWSGAPRAPLDRDTRERERQCRTEAEERRQPQDSPTALTESTADPSSASSASACPTPTSPTTVEQAEQVVRWSR